MRSHRWPILVLVIAVSACDGPATTAATNPSPFPDAPMNQRADGPIPPPDGGFIPFEDLEPEVAARMGRMVAAAERTPGPASSRSRDAREQRDPVRFAVSDEPLPGGAVAAVVRTPGPGRGRLIVISRDATDDRAMFLADAALDREEESDAGTLRRRVVFVRADGGLNTPDGAAEPLGVTVPAAGRHFIATLMHAAESGSRVHVPGVGMVRIAEP